MSEIQGTIEEFINLFKELSYGKNEFQVWIDLIDCMAVAISNRVDKKHYDAREKVYLDAIKRFDDPSKVAMAIPILAIALENNPNQDFLGKVCQTLGLLSSMKAQFFTPMSVSGLMANLQLDVADVKQKVAEQGYITICDPACGAGSTMIAAADILRCIDGFNYQTQALFIGCDIDPLVAKMCYIQLSLLGCPGYVVVTDTLTNPTEGDPLLPVIKEDQDYWFTPMFFASGWTMRRKFHQISNLFRS